MARKNDDDDPFARQPRGRSWEGTAKAPPPAEPLPAGSPGLTPPGPTPPTPPTPPTSYATPSTSSVPPPPPPSSDWSGSSAKNWMGVTSLVMGCTLVGAGLLGLIFGHLGLSAAKRGEANNRSVALAGVIVNYAVIAVGVIAVLVVSAIVGASDRSSTPYHTSGFSSPKPSPTESLSAAVDRNRPIDDSPRVTDYWWNLQVGNCVTDFWSFDDQGNPVDFTQPEVVPCGDSHFGEVYAIGRVGGYTSPNEPTWAYVVSQVCEGEPFDRYVGSGTDAQSGLYVQSSLEYDYFYPNASAWQEGGRDLVCVLYSPDGPITGSLKGSGQ